MPTTDAAIITGASGGMGACLAREMARRGTALLLVARRIERLEALARELGDTAPCFTLAMDLADTPAVGSTLTAALQKHALTPVALFNNAGAGCYSTFLEQPLELHERLWRINHLAAVETIRAVLPSMLDRRRGHVINICSMSSKIGPWGHSAYAASKAALANITQALQAEHPPERSGVHFTLVNPGIVKTEFFEHEQGRRLWPTVAKRAIPAETVARKVVELLDRPRGQLCVPWFYRFIEAIEAISPTLAQRIVAAQSRPRA
ncbi:MAG: SDR family NAD(P)-dependent oxidoreductase [Phycisphaerales bacterium]